MSDWTGRRPRLAYPFTILTEPGIVRLVAGEDYRYTLTGPNLDEWLPAVLARLEGRSAVADLVQPLDTEQRKSFLELVSYLYGERVLVDAPASIRHEPRRYRLSVQGRGALHDLLAAGDLAREGPTLAVLCQDSLDYAAALEEQRRRRAAGEPWLWASYGARGRGYVSPLFLPDAGPCWHCLLRSFRRVSPAPELYDLLLERRDTRSIMPVDFPAEALAILAALVRWKLGQAGYDEPDAGLYRLHVLERAGMEVSSHRVLIDPECPDCRGGQP